MDDQGCGVDLVFAVGGIIGQAVCENPRRFRMRATRAPKVSNVSLITKNLVPPLSLVFTKFVVAHHKRICYLWGMSTNEALTRAIEIAGSQAALAARIGVTQAHVSYWSCKAKKGVPPEHALTIERATGVSRHELRPDIFPDASLPGAPAPSSALSPEGGQAR